MAFSSGTHNALSEAVAWLGVAACLLASIIFFDEIKDVTRLVLGLPDPARLSDAGDNAGGQRRADGGRQKSYGSVVELDAGRGGHFFAEVSINGTDTPVLVDTGATHVSLSDDAARAVGIYLTPSDYTWRTRTANGIAKVAPVKLDSVSIGEITVRNVQAVVHEPGTLSTKTLLGMSFLSKLTRVDIRAGKLILEE